MTIFTFANNINTTLAGAVSPSATTITLSNTANLPASIPAGEVLVITLNDVATRQNFEVLYATARTGATLTALRAQEGTAALSWLTGDYAYSPPSAGQQQSFGQVGSPNTWTGANTFTSPVVVGAATASGDAVNLGQFSSSLSTNGYKKYPDPSSPSGYFIDQWGIATTSTGFATVTFPIAFPTACQGMWFTDALAATWSNTNLSVYGVNSSSPTLGTTGNSVKQLNWNGSSWGFGPSGTFFWRALGY